MLVLSAGDVRAALPMARAIEAMREAFTLLVEGRADLPLRTQVQLPDGRGVFLTMPARCDVPLGLGAKLVSVVPGNVERGRPLVHAALVLLDAETGEIAALLEGTSLTAIRTGAASGLATDLLARRDARRVAIIGSGVQARTQLAAVCCVRRIEAVTVYSRTRANAERFATEMAGIGDVPRIITVEPTAGAAAGWADIICLATTARTPVLAAAGVPEGAHVNAVGSFTPEMQEFEPALLGRARVVVDQREAAMAEAGEVIAAAKAGVVSRDRLVELGEVVVGRAIGRESERQVTVFKSVGLVVQDVCAGARVVAAALKGGP